MWKELLFNRQNIGAETETAYLIKMPHKSRYDGYAFWHPAKLVKDISGRGQYMALLYTDDFEFRMLKYGKGKYNKSTINDRKTLAGKDIAEALSQSNQAIADAIDAHNNKPRGIPLLKPPQGVEIDESLRDEN